MEASTSPLPGLRTDQDLVEQAQRGDRAAIERLMRSHNRLLYRVARGVLRNDDDAEDCVQEAYLQALRSLHRFRGESNLSTWLTRIVLNAALQRLRGRHRWDDSVSVDNVIDLEPRLAAQVDPVERPDDAAWRAEMRRLLEREIDRLPLPFRTVFVLRALEERSVEEAAACLGIPPATVRTRFFRARGLLREALERTLDDAVSDAFGFDGARCDRIVAIVLERLSSAPSLPSG